MEQIFQMDVDLFWLCLDAALKQNEEIKNAESNIPQNVVLVELKD